MRMLGACYTYGLGVRPDPARGRAWYQKAAESGDQMATLELYATERKR
jgi:TPR repeat protein